MNMQTPYCKTGIAATDLSAQLYRFAGYDANGRLTLCSSPQANISLAGPAGVLLTVATSLRGVTLATTGPAEVWAASTLAPGVLVSCNSVGGARAAASGDVVKGQYLGTANAIPGELAFVELCAPWRLTRTE